MFKDLENDRWLASISQVSASASRLMKQADGLPILICVRGRPSFYMVDKKVFEAMSKELADLQTKIERLKTAAGSRFNFLSDAGD